MHIALDLVPLLAAQVAPTHIEDSSTVTLGAAVAIALFVVTVVTWAVRLSSKVDHIEQAVTDHAEGKEHVALAAELDEVQRSARSSASERVALRAELDKIRTVAGIDAEHRQRQIDEIQKSLRATREEVRQATERLASEQRKALNELRSWIFANVLTQSGKSRRAPGAAVARDDDEDT